MKHQVLGLNLAELRKAKGLTQEDLVAKCNINVRTLQRIEAGEVIPRSYTLQAILTVLEVDYSNFISQYKISSKNQYESEFKMTQHSFKSILRKYSFLIYILLLLVFSFLLKFGMAWYFYILPVLIIYLVNTTEPETT
ncbi:MAG: helix-turn-helix transcriptional regulator [Saprospiraceae bacterium]|nr:helix-turn-helix transcriptional regulator [Saprospiraceae bacterium]